MLEFRAVLLTLNIPNIPYYNIPNISGLGTHLIMRIVCVPPQEPAAEAEM